MNDYSDIQLQLFLAKQLPEEIEYKPTLHQPAIKEFFWSRSYIPVTPREFDYIVRRVEEKLTPEQRKGERQKIWELSGKPDDYNECVSHAKYQLRAIALSQTLNIPIE